MNESWNHGHPYDLNMNENDVFHCFEESQPYAWGRQIVKQQMEMSRDLEDQVILILSITLIQMEKRLETKSLCLTRTRVVTNLSTCKKVERTLLNTFCLIFCLFWFIFLTTMFKKVLTNSTNWDFFYKRSHRKAKF